MRVTACLTSLLLSAVSVGCPDTGASYDDFSERYDKINPGTSVSTGVSQCETPVADAMMEIDGAWLFTLSVKLSAEKAFVLTSTFVTEEQPDGSLLVDLSLQPLSAADQTTPACGATHEYTDLVVNADGSFAWTLAPDDAPLSLCGEANPISGSEISTGLTISGTICGGAAAGFVCGPVTGTVATPIPNYDLTGSTYTMQKGMGGTFPPPVINCEKAPAMY